MLPLIYYSFISYSRMEKSALEVENTHTHTQMKTHNDCEDIEINNNFIHH